MFSITSIGPANMAKNNSIKRDRWYPWENDLLKGKAMKRVNNLYRQICSIENLQLADSIARKGKLKQPGVIEHDKNREANIQMLHEMLVNKTYRTSYGPA